MKLGAILIPVMVKFGIFHKQSIEMRKLALSILFLFSLVYSFAQVTVVDPRTFPSDTTIQDDDETYGRPGGTNKRFVMKYIRKYVRQGFSGVVTVNALTGDVQFVDDQLAWAKLTQPVRDSIIAGKKKVRLMATKPGASYLADMCVDTVGVDSIYFWNTSSYKLFQAGSGGVTDGNKVDLTVSGNTWTINNGVINNGKLAANAVDSTKAANLSPNDIAQTGASTNDVLTWTGSKYAPRPGSAGQASIQFKDEGSDLGTQGTVTAVDVTGAGATASRSGNTVTINVPGGGGSGSAENTRLSPKRVALIVFGGESNSGGLGVNALATSGELAAQQYVRIFNPTTRTIQQLDIGTNNLIGHSGFPENATHGWELELANQAFSRFADTVILVKCGQGGSTISQWVKGTTPMYYDTAISRINKTISLLKAEGKQVDLYLWWSQGINDAEAAVPAATWATNTKKVFANFRRDLGSFPIIMTQLIGASGATYTATLTGTLKNRDDGIFYIPTPQTAVGDSLLDSKHWNYLGLKAVANRFLNVMDSIGGYFNYQRNVKTGGVVSNSGVLESHGTDQAQIKTAGTTALSVTTTQQVGVGNNTPGASSLLSVGRSSDAYSQFHVGRGGNGGMYHLSFTDDIGIISQGASFGATGFTARSTSAMNLRFDNGAHIFQANTGLTVGNTFSPTQLGKWNAIGLRVGTGDPVYKLDVSGTGNFTGTLTVDNFIRATGASATLQTNDRADGNKRVSIFMNAGVALFNTTNYGVGFILFDDATGNTGIGGTTPTTSRFTLPASTTAGSSLRILSGVAPTSPVSGDIWNESGSLKFRDASLVVDLAKVLKSSATLDFPDTASGSSSSLTITVTGAATADSGVSIQRDNASIGGTFYEAVITGTNTVTVYFHNFSGSNQNPVSGTFRATVTK